MGIKKIARPINRSKNKFIEWLKKNNAEDIDVFEGKENTEFDYYRCVSAFIGENLYIVYFMIWNGNVKIDYSDGENKYEKMTLEDFNELINLCHKY